MTQETSKIVLFGIGLFEKELLRVLCTRFTVIAVDMNETLVETLCAEFPEVECLAGDPSSILTREKLIGTCFRMGRI